MPGYVMYMDADDCIHRNLVRYVHDHPAKSGYYFEYGYLHVEGKKWVWKLNDFHQYCGTSALHYCTADELPVDLNDDRDKYPILRWGHPAIKRVKEELGRPLDPLPFPGAVYNVGTGSNLSEADSHPWQSRRDLWKALQMRAH